MSSNRLHITSVTLFMFGYVLSAQTCPPTLEVRHVPAETKNWTAAPSVKISQLSSAQVIQVRPNGRNPEVDPEETRGRDGWLTLRWNLQGLHSGKFQLQCEYERTYAILTQDLPASVKGCTLRAKLAGKGKQLSTPPTVTCQ